jgi:hypothetical protein
MLSVRTLLATAGAVALLGVGGCGMAAPNASGVWVEVSPGTVTAGSAVMVRASCGDNSNSATVSSPAFGQVTLLPEAGLLMANVTIPPHITPSTFEVKLTCRTGSSATTTLTVLSPSPSASVAPTMATVGPHTGGGFLATGGSDRGAITWIAGGAAVMAVAGTVAITTRRRRRRAAQR